MDKDKGEINAMATSLNISDFLDPQLEKKSKYACFNQLGQLRNMIRKLPQPTTSSQRIFDTENIKSKKKSLPFEFDKLQNNTINSTEVILISSASSLENSNRNQALTPKKSVVKNKNNLRTRQCRKSLFKSIIAQDFKNKLNSPSKTLTETDFSPKTFSTPVQGKKRNEFLNKISDNNMHSEDLHKDKTEQIHTGNNEQQDHVSSVNKSKTTSLTSRVEINNKKCDETLKSNINCSMEKSNPDATLKTINNSIEMEISDKLPTNLTGELDNSGKKKEQTCYKTQKILIDDTLSRSENENINPTENCQLDEPVLENLAHNAQPQLLENVQKDSLQKIQEDSLKKNLEVSLQKIQEDLLQKEAKINKLNCKPSKIPKSRTPFIKNVQNSSFKKKAHHILTRKSFTKDLNGKSTEKSKKSFRKSISPPIPIITSPIIIHQVFNNNDSVFSEQHPNFEIIDVRTIPPPTEFQTNAKNNIEEDCRDIVTDDEDDIIVGTKKASICKNVTKNPNKTSKSICNEVLNANLSNALNSKVKHSEILNEKTLKNTTTTNNEILANTSLDSLITEDNSNSNKIKEISNVLQETSPISFTNTETQKRDSSIRFNATKTINRDSLIPLDLRKKKRLSKKRSLRSKEKHKAAKPARLQDYFTNTDDNIFEKLLSSKDKSYSKNHERSTRNNKKNSSREIRWPPNNRNDLGDNKPFAFREMNELETAAKRKRYSNQNSYNLRAPAKRNDNVILTNESDTINFRKYLEKEQSVLNTEKFINHEEETPNNESNFRWPTPPPPIVNNLNSESGQPSPKNNETEASPVFISTRNLRKRRLTVNPPESNNDLNNVQVNKKKKSNRTSDLTETTVNCTALILETNEILVHDDSTAANKIWSDAALSKTTNIDKSTRFMYSHELKKSRDSKKQYIEEYLQLSNRIQSKSQKEKRKLYASGSEASLIEKHPKQITDNPISMKSPTPVKRNEIVSNKEIVSKSSKSNEQPDKIKSNDFEFKKPVNPVPKKNKKKTSREIFSLLQIHPMYKLQKEDESTQSIDSNGNEIRRSGRTKENEKPSYDLTEYYKLVKAESRRLNMGLSKSKSNTKLKGDKKVGRRRKITINNETDSNNELVQNNNEPDNISKSKRNGEIDEYQNNLNCELPPDKTDVIESHSTKTKVYERILRSRVVVNLKRRDFSLIQENQKHDGQKKLESENIEPYFNTRVTVSNVSKSKKNKPNEFEINGDNQPKQTENVDGNKFSDVESNSDAQSAYSNPSEKMSFFNWIMSFNCALDKSREIDHNDLSVDSEGYRLATLKNMIFEKRKGVFYALYRTTVNSGYMKLLPGVQKPKVKSGRFYFKFLVLAGHVNASINNTELEFHPGDHIEVEKNQYYSIHNKSNEICCLYFTRNNHSD